MKLRTMAILMGLTALAAVGRFGAPAQGLEAPEHQVKAAFLFNFAKFVEWPAKAFTSTNTPLVFGVCGHSPVTADLRAAVQGRTLNGHPLECREVSAPNEMKACHVLFVPRGDAGRMKQILDSLDSASVLTVGESERFIEAGGMINFVLENDRMRFEINNGAARHAGLKISSKLLSLATVVKTK